MLLYEQICQLSIIIPLVQKDTVSTVTVNLNFDNG